MHMGWFSINNKLGQGCSSLLGETDCRYWGEMGVFLFYAPGSSLARMRWLECNIQYTHFADGFNLFCLPFQQNILGTYGWPNQEPGQNFTPVLYLFILLFILGMWGLPGVPATMNNMNHAQTMFPTWSKNTTTKSHCLVGNKLRWPKKKHVFLWTTMDIQLTSAASIPSHNWKPSIFTWSSHVYPYLRDHLAVMKCIIW